MKKLFILLLAASLAMVSCRKDEYPMSPESEQTVFVYMPWSSNLATYFQQNIEDFEDAIKEGILNTERVLVFLATSPTKASLFELKYKRGNSVRETIKDYQSPAVTTAAGISSILNDVKTAAPAKRYAMVIGSHGMGWLPVVETKSRVASQKYHWEYEGALLTRYFGGTTSEYQTDITTLAEGISNAGIKMEYIIFDDCYMSSVEVAYDLKDVTDYLIASPTEVMAYGFPYHIIGRYLVGNVDYYGICNGFYTFYQNYLPMPCGAIAVINCAEMDNLAAVMKEINQGFSFDSSLIDSIQPLDGYSPVIFFDYGDYVAKLCTDGDLLTRFEAQLERTVPSQLRMHTSTYYSAINRKEVPIKTYSGTTISDPSLNPIASSTKTNTAWYKATH